MVSVRLSSLRAQEVKTSTDIWKEGRCEKTRVNCMGGGARTHLKFVGVGVRAPHSQILHQLASVLKILGGIQLLFSYCTRAAVPFMLLAIFLLLLLGFFLRSRLLCFPLSPPLPVHRTTNS